MLITILASFRENIWVWYNHAHINWRRFDIQSFVTRQLTSNHVLMHLCSKDLEDPLLVFREAHILRTLRDEDEHVSTHTQNYVHYATWIRWRQRRILCSVVPMYLHRARNIIGYASGIGVISSITANSVEISSCLSKTRCTHLYMICFIGIFASESILFFGSNLTWTENSKFFL